MTQSMDRVDRLGEPAAIAQDARLAEPLDHSVETALTLITVMVFGTILALSQGNPPIMPDR